jgi:hypothetical protein
MEAAVMGLTPMSPVMMFAAFGTFVTPVLVRITKLPAVLRSIAAAPQFCVWEWCHYGVTIF